MGVRLGREVGYSTRQQRAIAPNTHLAFVTEGILLRSLVKDRALLQYSCVIIDEAHERGVMTDLILGLLRETVALRKDVKVSLWLT